MTLGSTQTLTEMSTRRISWGKGGRCVWLTTLPPSCAVMKSGNINFLEPSGPLQACNATDLPFFSPDNVYVSCSICIKDISSMPKESISNPTFESRTCYVGHFSIIPQGKTLPQKLRLAHLFKKFRAFYETENCIT